MPWGIVLAFCFRSEKACIPEPPQTPIVRMSKSSALATRPRRETISAYEKAQIYMQKKQEEEERAAQSVSDKTPCESSDIEAYPTEEQKDSATNSVASKANLKRLVTTGMSRGSSTQGSSDWLHAWGVDSDMKREFDVNDSFLNLEPPTKTPRDSEDENAEPAGAKKPNDKSKTFSKVKEVLKSKFGRSKNHQGPGSEGQSEEESEKASS